MTIVGRGIDDPAGAGVCDRAEVELALVGRILGDIAEPQLVRGFGGEVAFNEAVVHRRAGFLPLPAAFLSEP